MRNSMAVDGPEKRIQAITKLMTRILIMLGWLILVFPSNWEKTKTTFVG